MAKKKTAKKKPASKLPGTSKRTARRAPAAVPAAAPAATGRVLNCVPSPETHRDWRFEHAFAAGIVSLAAPPPSVDLRAAWWDVGDQRDTGACVGWALADSVLRFMYVEAGELPQAQKLSARFLWMAATETDEFNKRPETFIEKAGTSLKAALNISREHGVVTEVELPTFGGGLYGGDPETLYAIAAQRRISMYIGLFKQQEWRPWLALRRPILIRVEVDRTWQNAKQTAGKLEFYDPYPPGHPLSGGHAAAIVGYTAEGDFIVRNSWGTQPWGDNGFGYATQIYAEKAVTEAYGVTI